MAESDATKDCPLAIGPLVQEVVGDARVCTHTERGTPFFGDDLRETDDTSFGQAIIGLTCVAIDTTGAADIDDVPRLPVLDAEIGRSGSHELERSSIVEGNDGVPLLVCHLQSMLSVMVACQIPTLGSVGSFHTLCMTPSHVNPALLTMIWILPPPNSAAFFTSSSMYCAFNISPGTAVACPPASLIAFATALALSIRSRMLLVSSVPARPLPTDKSYSTGVDVLHDNLCTFLGKEMRCLSADSLTATRDYGDLVS